MASNWISDIQWDAKGPYRVFLQTGSWGRSGEKTYVSPAEVSPSNTTDPKLLQWAESHQAPGGGYLHGRGVWNDDTGEWDQPINGGNLLATGIGAAIGGVALPSALASGSSAVPALGNVNGTVDSLMAGGAGTGGGTGLSAALARLKTPSGIADAALKGLPAILAASQAFGGGGGPFGGEDQSALMSEIRDSIAAQRKRFDATQPAFETSQRMALGMAPTRYRSGPFGAS